MVFGVSATPSSELQLEANPGSLVLPHVCGRFNQCPTSWTNVLLPDGFPVPILPQ